MSMKGIFLLSACLLPLVFMATLTEAKPVEKKHEKATKNLETTTKGEDKNNDENENEDKSEDESEGKIQSGSGLNDVYHHNYPFPGSPYPHPYPEAGPESFPGPYPEHVPYPVLHHQKYQESDKNKGKQKFGDEKKGKESKQH